MTDTREAAVAALGAAIREVLGGQTRSIPRPLTPARILDALTPPQRAALAAWLVPEQDSYEQGWRDGQAAISGGGLR
jgi:hypothetical protein